MDINPDNNRDTFKGRRVRIKELEEQIEQLKQKLLETEQTKGLLCDKCGWSMKFPDESCRCELEEQVEQLKQKLLYKQERFDKLWDLCNDTQYTTVALRFFEKWENE
jgi:tmRNA-binding protein